ncbi:MAG: hypothetical protein QOJ58_4573, partial [Alphaproteobacteria bacterium]|nr:hypothetical protein [Alphaproteobacteria bacterium]
VWDHLELSVSMASLVVGVKTDQAKGNLKQAGEKIKDTFK